MLRRLYFLFPDEKHAQNVVDELINKNISERHIHALTHGIELKTLPKATERQARDTAFRIEWAFWNINLLIFLLALAGLITALATGETLWAVIALAVMLITFIAGEQFAIYLPDVNLTEFTDALSHGEILLMVDVPKNRVAEIEHYVHHRHPDAIIGGVSWAIDAFRI